MRFGPPENLVRVVDPGIPFAIGFDETVHLADSTTDITFTAIIQDGRQALERNNYRRAIDDFKRAILNIEVGNYIEWGALETEARDLLEQAVAKRDEAERQQTEAARARSIAERRAQETAELARRQAQVDGAVVTLGGTAAERRRHLARRRAGEIIRAAANSYRQRAGVLITIGGGQTTTTTAARVMMALVFGAATSTTRALAVIRSQRA